MGAVVMHNVVSVDGYIADEADDVGPLFEWYANGDTTLGAGGAMVSRVSAEYVQPVWDSIGSMLIGRRLFDMTNGWEGRPPAGDHVVVVSRRPERGHPRRPGAAPALSGSPPTGRRCCVTAGVAAAACPTASAGGSEAIRGRRPASRLR